MKKRYRDVELLLTKIERAYESDMETVRLIRECQESINKLKVENIDDYSLFKWDKIEMDVVTLAQSGVLTAATILWAARMSVKNDLIVNQNKDNENGND